MAKRSYLSYNNSQILNSWRMKLMLLALTMFKYNGFPETINKRFLTRTLVENGKVLFYNDKAYGYLVTQCTQFGRLNVYNEPVAYTTTTPIGYSLNLRSENCVIIRLNPMEAPLTPILEYYAGVLYDIDTTANVNIHNQKTPFLMQGTEAQQLTLKNLYNRIELNEPSIIVDKSFNLTEFKVIPTVTPFIADKLVAYKQAVLQEVYALLGIHSANVLKKERLVTAEAESDLAQVDAYINIMLSSLQEACEEINRKYGLNVGVELRNEVDLQEDLNVSRETLSDDSKGGDE